MSRTLPPHPHTTKLIGFSLYLLLPNSFPYYSSALLHSKELMFLHTALKAKIRSFQWNFSDKKLAGGRSIKMTYLSRLTQEGFLVQKKSDLK